MFGVDCCFEQKALSNRFRANARIMKQRYLSHIIYVKSVVPEDKLLIWNIKDGWEPLCKFLEVPVRLIRFVLSIQKYYQLECLIKN